MSPTDEAIAALRAGDQAAARVLLTVALRANPNDARAWLWLSGTLSDPARQRYCLERALALDPGCEPARRGLAALDGVAVSDVPRQPSAAGATPGRPETESPASRGERAPAVAQKRRSGALPRPIEAIRPWLSAALAGVSAVLAWAAWRNLGDEAARPALLALALVAGAPLGVVALLIGGVLLRTAGRWLGGRAGAARVRVALARAVVPPATGLALWALQLAALPTASFGSALVGTAEQLLATLCGLIHAALWCWAAVRSIAGLAEAHSLPWARVAASWLLAALIVGGSALLMLAGAALVIGLRGG
ncbi:MAG: hypothetical protein OHK0015_51120 [Chloroflexi bacterium OHK40]